MPESFYREVPPVDPKDLPEHTYSEIPPTDEDGVLVPPAGKHAVGDKSGAAADSKEK